MTDLPELPHAVTEPLPDGFSLSPAEDSSAGHAAFQHAVERFMQAQLEWEMLMTRPGRYGAWEAAVFIPARAQ